MTTRSKVRRIVTRAIYSVVFLSLLVIAGSIAGNQAALSRTQANDEEGFKCHNATLKGRYATRGDGFIPGGPPPAPMVPFAAVSLMTLDGSGKLTNDVTTSTNGDIERNVNPGTYALNKNCKGQMTINIPEPPFVLNFDLVVADGGKEFDLIATTPSVVTIGGKRVD